MFSKLGDYIMCVDVVREIRASMPQKDVQKYTFEDVSGVTENASKILLEKFNLYNVLPI